MLCPELLFCYYSLHFSLSCSVPAQVQLTPARDQQENLLLLSLHFISFTPKLIYTWETHWATRQQSNEPVWNGGWFLDMSFLRLLAQQLIEVCCAVNRNTPTLKLWPPNGYLLEYTSILHSPLQRYYSSVLCFLPLIWMFQPIAL